MFQSKLNVVIVLLLGVVCTAGFFNNSAPPRPPKRTPFSLSPSRATLFPVIAMTPVCCGKRFSPRNATVGVKETIKFKIPANSANCDANAVCTIKLLGAAPRNQ